MLQNPALIMIWHLDVISQVFLKTIMMALFSIPLNNDRKPVSQQAQCQDPNTDETNWNSSIIKSDYLQQSFPAVKCQNVFSIQLQFDMMQLTMTNLTGYAIFTYVMICHLLIICSNIMSCLQMHYLDLILNFFFI